MQAHERTNSRPAVGHAAWPSVQAQECANQEGRGAEMQSAGAAGPHLHKRLDGGRCGAGVGQRLAAHRLVQGEQEAHEVARRLRLEEPAHALARCQAREGVGQECTSVAVEPLACQPCSSS